MVEKCDVCDTPLDKDGNCPGEKYEQGLRGKKSLEQWLNDYPLFHNEMLNKHLEIKEIEQKAKTKVYSVTSKHDGYILGWIKWYGAWRQYVFQPAVHIHTVWSDDCTLALYMFLKKLKVERKPSYVKKGDTNAEAD